jgi:hypothetical protein
LLCSSYLSLGVPNWVPNTHYHYSDDKDNDANCGEKSAHIASYGVDSNWYTDTGATDHITNELNKLSIHEKYNGNDHVRDVYALLFL